MVGRIGISRRPFLWGIAQATALVLGLSSPGAPILSGADYHTMTSRFISDDHGIADERGYYYYDVPACSRRGGVAANRRTSGSIRAVRRTRAI